METRICAALMSLSPLPAMRKAPSPARTHPRGRRGLFASQVYERNYSHGCCDADFVRLASPVGSPAAKITGCVDA